RRGRGPPALFLIDAASAAWRRAHACLGPVLLQCVVRQRGRSARFDERSSWQNATPSEQQATAAKGHRALASWIAICSLARPMPRTKIETSSRLEYLSILDEDGVL